MVEHVETMATVAIRVTTKLTRRALVCIVASGSFGENLTPRRPRSTMASHILGLRWKRAPHARRRLMRNSRYALILLIVLLVVSSGVVASPLAPSRPARPARPATVSRTPPRAAVPASTANDPFIGIWKLN